MVVPADLLQSRLDLFDCLLRSVTQTDNQRHQERLQRDSVVLIRAQSVEFVMEQVFAHLLLHLYEIFQSDVLFVFEDLIHYLFVCRNKVFIACFDSTGIDCNLVLLFVAIPLFLPQFGQFGGELVLGDSFVFVLFEDASELTVRSLENSQKEVELCKTDSFVIVSVNQSENTWSVLF